MIRTLFFILLSFFIYKSKSWPKEMVIESLEEGSCWIHKEIESDNFSLASFNTGQSFKIYYGDFMKAEKEILEQLRKMGIAAVGDENKYMAYLKCNYQGGKIYLNYYLNKKQVCVELIPLKGLNEGLKISGILPFHDGGDEFCEGQQKGELLINLKAENEKNPEAVKKCRENLMSEYGSILKVERWGDKGQMIIKIFEENHYNEKMIRERIINERICHDLINEKNIDYNNLHSIMGSWYFLFNR